MHSVTPFDLYFWLKPEVEVKKHAIMSSGTKLVGNMNMVSMNQMFFSSWAFTKYIYDVITTSQRKTYTMSNKCNFSISEV